MMLPYRFYAEYVGAGLVWSVKNQKGDQGTIALFECSVTKLSIFNKWWFPFNIFCFYPINWILLLKLASLSAKLALRRFSSYFS